MSEGLKVNPWWEMWVRPKGTIRAIIDHHNRYGFVSLCFLYGLVQGAHLAQVLSLGAYYPLWIIMIVSAIAAVPIGAISFSISSIVLYWTGKILKGKGSYHDIRAAVSWSHITAVLSLVFVGIMVLTFREAFFYKSFAETVFQDWKVSLVFSFLLLEVILSIWTLVLFILALSEVQRFSVWMAILNIILVIVLYLIILFLVSTTFSLIKENNIGLL